MASRTGKDDAEPRRARLEEQASMLPRGALAVAERIEAAGILQDGEVRRAVRRLVDRLGTDFLVTCAEHAQCIRLK